MILPDLLLGRDATVAQDVWLTRETRLQGTYVLGKTGYGKSSLLINMISQDMHGGHGVGVLDPHGDLIIDVLASLPEHRKNDVILLDLQDEDFPFAFNLFDCADPTNPRVVAQTAELVTAVFKRVWGEGIGPRSQDLLENTVYTMVANPGATLDDVPKFFSDQTTRQRMVRRVQDVVVRSFWEAEFDQLRPGNQQQITAPILNKIRSFLRNPVLRSIVRQPRAPDFNAILRERKILLVRLDQELPEASSLLGTLITRRILQAAFARASQSVRDPFFLYADEFQRFATPDYGTLLQEARKFGIGTILAHQLRSQLDRELRSFVLGASTIICFQLTADDAREMRRELGEVSLPKGYRDDPLNWILDNGHPDPVVYGLVWRARVSATRAAAGNGLIILPSWENNTLQDLWGRARVQFAQCLFDTKTWDLRLKSKHERLWEQLPTDKRDAYYEMQWRLQQALKILLAKTDDELGTLPELTAQARVTQDKKIKTITLKIEHTVSLSRRRIVHAVLEEIHSPYQAETSDVMVAMQAFVVREKSRRRYATPRAELDTPPLQPKPVNELVKEDVDEVIFYDNPEEPPGEEPPTDERKPRLPWH